MAADRLDLLGEVCPVPLLRTQERVARLAPGEALRVQTDFARSVRNIIDWCNREGHTYTLREPAPGVWELEIRRAGAGGHGDR